MVNFSLQWIVLAWMLLSAGALFLLWNRLFRPRIEGRWAALLAVLALVPLLPALRSGHVYGPFDTNVPALPWVDAADAGYKVRGGRLNDVTLQFLPWQTEARRQILAGRVPLLNPDVGAGHPLMANAQSAPFSLISLLALPLEPLESQAFRAFLKLLLALGGTFLAARHLGCRPAAALLAAVAYAFGGSLAVWRLFPHAEVMAVFPFAFLASERLLTDRGDLRSRLLLGLALGDIVLAGHPETAFTACLVLGGRWLFALLRAPRDEGRRRAVALLLLVSILAALGTSFFLFPVAEAVLHSEKLDREGGGEDLGRPGNAPGAALGGLLNLAVPGIFGTPQGSGEAGPAPLHWLAEGAVGLPALVLALTGLFAGRGRSETRTFLLLLAVLAFLVHLDPGGLLRPVFALPLLSVLAVRYFAYLGGFAVALLAAGALDLWMGKVRSRPLATAGALAAVTLTVGQLWVSLGGYYPVLDRAHAYPPVPLLDQLAAQPGPFRLIGTRGVLMPSASSFYRLMDVRAHDPMQPARYIAWLHETLDVDLTRHKRQYAIPKRRHVPFLRLLGVRYLLTGPNLNPGPPWIDRGLFRKTRLWELPGEPRWAFFPEAVVPAASARRAREIVRAADRPLRMASLEMPGPESPIANGPAEALRWRVDGDRLAVDTRVEQDAWMVVAQAALPGWRARADGRPAQVAIADGALLAVRVPAGTRTVVLRYLPTSWIAGLALSISVWILSAILLTRGLRR